MGKWPYFKARLHVLSPPPPPSLLLNQFIQRLHPNSGIISFPFSSSLSLGVCIGRSLFNFIKGSRSRRLLRLVSSTRTWFIVLACVRRGVRIKFDVISLRNKKKRRKICQILCCRENQYFHFVVYQDVHSRNYDFPKPIVCLLICVCG